MLLSACQPRLPPRPFHVTLSDFLYRITLHSSQLVVEKLTCISSCLTVRLRSDVLYSHDRSNTDLMNEFWREIQRCNLSFSIFFSLLFSISGATVNECQHCGKATTHLVHQPSPLNWWMISCWQAVGYYHGFRAKRNATALQQMSFQILTKPPTEMRRKRYHCIQLTHSAHVCSVWVIDHVQHRRQSGDACAPIHTQVGVLLHGQCFHRGLRKDWICI